MNSFEVEIPCPHCGRRFKERMANMKPGNTRTCPSCRVSIQYTGDDASKLERDVKRSIDEFKRKVRNLNRQSRF